MKLEINHFKRLFINGVESKKMIILLVILLQTVPSDFHVMLDTLFILSISIFREHRARKGAL